MLHISQSPLFKVIKHKLNGYGAIFVTAQFSVRLLSHSHLEFT